MIRLWLGFTEQANRRATWAPGWGLAPLIIGGVFLAAVLGVRTPADAQFGLGGDPVVSVDGQFTAPDGEGRSRLFVTATIDPGWYIYGMDLAPDRGPIPSSIQLEDSDEFQLVGRFRAYPEAEVKVEPLFDDLRVPTHAEQVVWHAPIELAADVDARQLVIRGHLRAQPCDATSCLPPQPFEFSARLGPGEEVPIGEDLPLEEPEPAKPGIEPLPPVDAPAPPATPAQGDGTSIPWQPFVTVDAFRQLTGSGPGAFDIAQVQAAAVAERGTGGVEFFGYLGLGFLGGLILNVMPCVLPLIGLKVMAFIEQSEHNRARAFMLNLWFSLGLLSVFVLLAVLAVTIGYGWGQLFSLAAFNIVLAAIVFVFGLSFLGVWEVPIPGFAGGGKATDLAKQEGAVGAFSKGILTTIMATPCSAPLLGPALAWGMAQPAEVTFTVVVAVGLGMASPYLVAGAFPEVLRFLPKPGEWMETFKQIMGFVLMGTVVYILYFMPLPLVVPTVGLLFGLWAACWWINRTPAYAETSAKLKAWAQAAVVVALVWWAMFPGLRWLGNDPFQGWLGTGSALAQAAERVSFSGLANIMERRFDRAIERAVILQTAGLAGYEESTVLIEFTADWCLTCKTLEATVLDTPAVREAVHRNRVVTLKADWTDADPEITRMLETLGSRQVPTVAVFPAGRANEPIVFRGGYTQRGIIDAIERAGPSRGAPLTGTTLAMAQ